ncbi:MAG: hypothetical protein QF464_21940, partial [Myxococcota bacterium]|nr:hypothetical protein [Myxococcota bacterium]
VLGEAAELIVRLSVDPDDTLIEALRGIDSFGEVAFDRSAERLRVRFDPGTVPAGRAAKVLVDTLVERDVAFIELQIGKRLEERFLEETS